MRLLSALPLALKVLVVSGAFILATQAHAWEPDFQAATPEGFEDLQSERQVLLDVNFGGEKIGQALATIQPGILRFENPASVAQMIPDVASLAEVTDALTSALPTNTSLVCSSTQDQNCGTLQPARAGIILNEDRFSVEIFVNAKLLALANDNAAGYLPHPEARPSLISLFGVTVSGSSDASLAYHVQNRSVASVGATRLRSDSSLATRFGLSFDNLALESDRSGARYLGGIFWAPGSDLVGRRKIAGLGITTQLDTRTDKTALTGTPLAIFLQQPSRVELLVDGRVFSSRIYSAGHRLIDTSALPVGSYDVVLRIQEHGWSARSERRFFTKGSLMAPVGHPLLSAFAGFLQSSSRGLSVGHKAFFFQASGSYRVVPAVGVDATIVGSQRKAILEAGTVLSTRIALVRAAALVSSAGDLGLVLRASTLGRGPLALSFDLRQVKSRDGQPLLPVSTSIGTFSEDPTLGSGRRGTYLQGIATVDYRFRQGTVRLSGLYRQDGPEDATYSVAASLEVPVIRTRDWDLRFDADVRQTEIDVSSFVGLRFLLNNQSIAVSGSAGVRRQSNHAGRSAGLVAEIQSGSYRQLADDTQLSTDIAYGRDLDGGYARGSSYVRGARANIRADALHQFGEGDGTTQFAVTADSAITLNDGNINVGAGQMNDAAVVVAVSGGGDGQRFEVLVDEVVRGSVSDGRSVALFLAPYETYQIRLRSQDMQVTAFETATQKTTLFPGNVVNLQWDITPLVVLFGRAVDLQGKSIPFAEIRGPHGIGRTDGEGYFQIEANREDRLEVSSDSGAKCTVSVPETEIRDGYVSAGDVMCR